MPTQKTPLTRKETVSKYTKKTATIPPCLAQATISFGKYSHAPRKQLLKL